MFIADLHTHSKYSRATSRECIPEYLDLWGRRKGIDLIGSGDFTHPAWREELQEKLVPAEEGLYTLREDLRLQDAATPDIPRPRFVISGEISSIYKKNGKVRKIHNVILLPGLEDAHTLALKLERIGNLHSDGRPILGLDSRDLLEIVLESCPQAIFIPAHIWTPHFSLFGAFSGFDTLQECFGDLSPHIHALETGLSSDPSMNWRLSALDGYTLVSNSDAHSPSKLGREANLIDAELSYASLYEALQHPNSPSFAGTIEFFPEEGKYHYDGHRACKVCLDPAQAEHAGGRCPVCGARLTFGVLHRVDQLADRAEGYRPAHAKPYECLVPLPEAIAASTGFTVASAKVRNRYEDLLQALGPEFFILRQAPLEDIQHIAGPCVAEGIRRVRAQQVQLAPGYDGEYGKIHLLDENEIQALSGQISFLGTVEKQKSTHKRGQAGPKRAQKAQAATQPHTDILESLNEAQRSAVTATEPAIAVIAGPGTGKTKTLVSRIAYLVEQQGVSPAHITAVTFTNKAAAEMRERLQSYFGNKRIVSRMHIGTFHAIFLQLLQKDKTHAYNLLGEDEAAALAADTIDEFALKLSPQKFLRLVSSVKNAPDQSPWPSDLSQAAYQSYNARLQRYRALDFDDVLLNALEKFSPTTPHKINLHPFTHLLVDEFQDINDVQYRLIRACSRNSDSLFVIGDPDQAIYGFRGSDARCFLRLQSDCPQLRHIHLTNNYRSTPQILGCAAPVIAQNPPLKGGRSLYAHRTTGTPVRVLSAADEFSQALFVAKEINRMVGGIDMLDAHAMVHGSSNIHGFSDIALLYRTHRQAQMLEKCLKIEGIPYIVCGRDQTLSQPSVRAALAFFRLLLHPSDTAALCTCLSLLLGCSKLEIQATMESDALSTDDHAAPRPNLLPPLGDLEQSETYAHWRSLTQTFLPLVHKQKPQKLIELWARENALEQDDSMDKLVHMACLYKDMSTFLQMLSMGEESDVRRSGHRAYRSDSVSLMTLHGAKGLEFPVVFICGVSQGSIPLQTPGMSTDMEEERRLFYVGMTRAQQELILLTLPQPSQFLQALPSQHILRGKAEELDRPTGKQLSFL